MPYCTQRITRHKKLVTGLAVIHRHLRIEAQRIDGTEIHIQSRHKTVVSHHKSSQVDHGYRIIHDTPTVQFIAVCISTGIIFP